MCPQCAAGRVAVGQWRGYSDASLTGDGLAFPRRENRSDELRLEEEAGLSSPLSQMRRSWELRSNEASASAQCNTTTTEERVISAVEDGSNVVSERLDQTEEISRQDTQARAATSSKRRFIPGDRALLDIDYASALPQALAANEPDMVARCLYAAQKENDLEFVQSLPRTTFLECIRVLQPSNFTLPLTSTHMDLSDAVAKQLGLTPIQHIVRQHSNVLKDMLAIRRRAGAAVGLPEYRMLLQSARDLGRPFSADRIWRDLLEDGVTPDTACYNALMGAHAWHGLHRASSRRSDRITPFSQLARQRSSPPPMFATYRVGEGGIKEHVTRMFSSMLKDGAIADEESFRNVIIATAREGDMATVKAILRRIWDVDVDSLQASKPAATVTTTKPLNENSPLAPNSKTLFALAYAFGINNDVPAGLRVVGDMAQRYNLSIDLNVWEQLFEWTFVLASMSTRTGVKAQTDGSRTGQLPRSTALTLWESMTGAPYFVQPTMGMYNHLIKNLQDRAWPREIYAKMLEGRELSLANQAAARRALRVLERAVKGDNSTGKSLETLRRKWEHADLVRKRDIVYCKRWLRLFLSTLRQFNRSDTSQDWALRETPRILWEWRAWAPTVVKYDVTGGVVELQIRTAEDIEVAQEVGAELKQKEESVAQQVPMFLAGSRTAKFTPFGASD